MILKQIDLQNVRNNNVSGNKLTLSQDNTLRKETSAKQLTL